MDVRWMPLKPGEDAIKPGDVGLWWTARMRLPFLNAYLWLARRCTVCGDRRRLTRADMVVRAVPKQDGRRTIAFKMVGWLCVDCMRECHQDGAGG